MESKGADGACKLVGFLAGGAPQGGIDGAACFQLLRCLGEDGDKLADGGAVALHYSQLCFAGMDSLFQRLTGQDTK